MVTRGDDPMQSATWDSNWISVAKTARPAQDSHGLLMVA